MRANKELKKKLKENGFWILRAGAHEIWTDGSSRILCSQGAKVSPNTYKMTLVQLKRALEKRSILPVNTANSF